MTDGSATARPYRGPTASSGGRALRALARWAAGTLAMLLATSLLVFGLTDAFPGDPAAALVANATGRIPAPAEVAAKRHELGLDRPVIERYRRWAGALLRGDLGRSWTEPAAITDLLLPRARTTLLLGGVALVIGLALTIVIGTLSAVRAGSVSDHAARLFSVAVASLPAFVIGLLVLQYVVIGLHVGTVLTDGTWRTLPLPAAVLGIVIAAAWVRPFRAMMRDAYTAPFAHAARARGRRPLAVALRVALPVALVDFLPFIGLALGSMLGATVLVEIVFAWPGLGGFAAEAALRRDVPAIQAFTLLSVVAFRVSVDLTRLAGVLADPRRRAWREA